jgi:hypothetical protein
MNFEDRLLHAFIVVFYVCFFLATLVCVIATPLQLAHPQEDTGGEVKEHAQVACFITFLNGEVRV